jgi:hypothetical protein
MRCCGCAGTCRWPSGSAGARLAARPAWTVGYLAGRLGDQRRRLAEIATADRSVAAALTVSYQQLTPGQQRLFRLLGLHPGPDFDAYLAAALASMTLAEAEQVLEDLVDAHLLEQPAPGRYRFHDLLRDHAQAAARQAETSAARSDAIGRELDYYLQVAHQASAILRPGRPRPAPDLAHPPARTPRLAGQAGALSWCESEHANLMSAAVALALGGRAGARISARLAAEVSRVTLTATTNSAPTTMPATPISTARPEATSDSWRPGLHGDTRAAA